MDMTIRHESFDPDGEVRTRIAARGIIRHGDLYLFIFGSLTDYKFPGGGVDDGETLEETLIREVREETGYAVIPDTIEYYGVAHEFRRGKNFGSCLQMDSHYFLCDVAEAVGERNLDPYEEELNYQVIWLPLEEALRRNRLCENVDDAPWLIRDTKVMEYIINYYNK